MKRNTCHKFRNCAILCGAPFAPQAPYRRRQQGEMLMRAFASAFLSAIAAVSISGTLFSAILI
jgi:hypothetical protein